MKLFTAGTSRNASIGKFAAIGCALVILSTLTTITDPVQILVNTQLALKPGRLLYNLWLKPPVDVFIMIYMFNVTNFDAFARGIDKKLKVKEVGPYVYQEFVQNHNVTFNSNNTLSYTPRHSVKFIRERSVGDPKVDRILAPNVPYMGVTSAAAGFSAFAAIAVKALSRRLNSKPIINVSVEEYLWGYDDPLVHLASKLLPNLVSFDRFGLLDRMLDEGDNIVTIKLPDKKRDTSKAPNTSEYNDYSIDNWNGERGLRNWDYRENRNNTRCNTLAGAYDGSLFPRNISKGESFRVFRKIFCRTLPIVYSHPSTYKGIETYNFKLTENALNSDLRDPESACYCKANKCLKKGLGNLTPCYYNIPLAVSLPHFLNSDPSLLEPLEGLSPNETRHTTTIMIQPELGVPLKVHTRLQVNILLGDIKFDADMSRFSNIVLPIFWAEMGVDELSPGILLLLKLLFKVCPYTQLGFIIVSMGVGVSLICTALLLCFWEPATWNSLETSCNTETKAKVPAVCLLPLLTQPAEKLTKRQMKKVKREYDVMLLPLRRNTKEGLMV